MFAIKATKKYDDKADMAEVNIRIEGFSAFVGLEPRREEKDKVTPEERKKILDAELSMRTRDVVSSLVEE